MNRGIKVLQTFALPLGDGTILGNFVALLQILNLHFYGAEDGTRTRDICLGKATLYH